MPFVKLKPRNKWGGERGTLPLARSSKSPTRQPGSRRRGSLPDTVALMAEIRHPMYSHGTSSVGVPAQGRARSPRPLSPGRWRDSSLCELREGSPFSARQIGLDPKAHGLVTALVVGMPQKTKLVLPDITDQEPTRPTHKCPFC